MKTCPVCDTPYPDHTHHCPTDGAVLIESQELEPGHIVRGKYRIVRKLGSGGMGVVYLAEHILLGGQLALKFLATELSRNPQFIKRFRQEARAAYQLRHPNIVEVNDLDQDEGGGLFIAMEFVPGASLRAELGRNPRGLPIDRALALARGIASGLAAAHARGAIHRDIKPENILLATAPGGGDQPKILDFGIAAMAEGITNLSHTHGLLLTPEYAAPEQWRGTPANELDGRTDLYALGGVLYEMLSGRTPFRAHNMEGWMYQHLQGTIEPLGRLRPSLEREHPGLEAVVMRLLAREREQRYPSATAALEALQPRPPAPIRRETVVEPPVIRKSAEPAQNTEPGPRPNPEPPPPAKNRIPAIAAGLVLAAAAVWAVVHFVVPNPAAAVPVLSPAAGTYARPQPIAISDPTPHAVIHYTVDGSAPTESSPVYEAPIASLPSGAMVRAIATADGYRPSADIAGAYVWDGSSHPIETPVHPPSNPIAGSGYDTAKAAYDRKDYTRARTLFNQACQAGEMRACNYLGFLWAQGLGGARDQNHAAQVYLAACNQGNALSCTSLGTLFQNSGSLDQARKYFKKACDLGEQKACAVMGDASQ
ncbi:MAG: protein kinase [Terracidiphilus sp.]